MPDSSLSELASRPKGRWFTIKLQIFSTTLRESCPVFWFTALSETEATGTMKHELKGTSFQVIGEEVCQR